MNSIKVNSFTIIVSAFELVAQKAKGEKRNFVFQARPDLGIFPYWGHLSNVFEQLVMWGVTDVDVLVAGILHDIVEDHGVTLDEIETIYGHRVRKMVDLCTKPLSFNKDLPATVNIYFQRFWYHLKINKEEARGAMMIKVSDRLTNLIGIQFTEDKERKLQYILETEKYFIPMAKEIGLENQLKAVLGFAKTIEVSTISQH